MNQFLSRWASAVVTLSLMGLSACQRTDSVQSLTTPEVTAPATADRPPVLPIQSPEPSASPSDHPSPGPTIAPSPLPTATPTPVPTGSPAPRTYSTGALIFNGTGTSVSDANSLASIVNSHGLTYRIVNSAQLDAMSLDEISDFGVIVWPGGHATQMTNGLQAATRERVRQAVNDRGVGYNGYCAGAWMAVGPTPSEGKNPAWGLSIIDDSILNAYNPPAGEISMVSVSFPSGDQRSLVFWGGPYLWNFKDGVIAKYSDGKAAIAQAWAGKGFVTISGPHPEAPQGWRTGQGLVDSDGLDYDIAWNLVHAALVQEPLPTF